MADQTNSPAFELSEYVPGVPKHKLFGPIILATGLVETTIGPNVVERNALQGLTFSIVNEKTLETVPNEPPAFHVSPQEDRRNFLLKINCPVLEL